MYSCVFLGYFSVWDFFVLLVIPFIRKSSFTAMCGRNFGDETLAKVQRLYNFYCGGRNPPIGWIFGPQVTRRQKESPKPRNNPETRNNIQEVSCFIHFIEEMLKRSESTVFLFPIQSLTQRSNSQRPPEAQHPLC